MYIPLSDLKINQTGIIKKVNSSNFELLNMGLTICTKVKCVLTNSSNDLKAYLIRGSLIAIRKEDLEGVLVCI